MKVRDLLKMETDIDVYDDVCEELGIAFCGPMMLTEEGEKEFGEVLDYPITITNGSFPCAIVGVDGDDWKERLKKAKRFFWSLAGYCYSDDYDRWFIDDTDEIRRLTNDDNS